VKTRVRVAKLSARISVEMSRRGKKLAAGERQGGRGRIKRAAKHARMRNVAWISFANSVRSLYTQDGNISVQKDIYIYIRVARSQYSPLHAGAGVGRWL